MMKENGSNNLPARPTGTPQKTKQQWLNEGNVLSEAKRYEEALAAFEQAIRLDPYSAIAYASKGNLLRKLKRYNEAFIAFVESLQLDPHFATLTMARDMRFMTSNVTRMPLPPLSKLHALILAALSFIIAKAGYCSILSAIIQLLTPLNKLFD